MKSRIQWTALAAALLSFAAQADELSAGQAEALLKPVMATDCGVYYTEQGEPDFADLEGKLICSYQPRVTHISTAADGTTVVEYTHDRVFDSTMSAAWLGDYARMAAHKEPSMLFKKLKSNLEMWLAQGGVNTGYRPARATFKLGSNGWQVVDAP